MSSVRAVREDAIQTQSQADFLGIRVELIQEKVQKEQSECNGFQTKAELMRLDMRQVA